MNAKSLIGMTVFAIEGGKNLGTVERLLFSPEEMRITSLVVTPVAGLLDEPEGQKILPTSHVNAIGQDAITIESESLLETAVDGEVPAGTVAFDEIEKEKVITESGDDVGELSSLDFNQDDFRLDFLEVGRGFLSGASLITVDKIVSIGEDVIVVRDTALNQEGATARDDDNVVVEDETLVEDDRDDDGPGVRLFGGKKDDDR